MSRIIIEAVERRDMRPPYNRGDGTAGDWFVNPDGDLVVRVVGIDPLRHDDAFLIALHELVEAKLCMTHGVGPDAVDAFDAAFAGDGEPGDAWDAPYRKEHRRAMLIEMLMASFLGLDDYGTIE